MAQKLVRRALVVDDESLIRWSVAETLADAGVDVRQAADASSAMNAVSTAFEAFDALIVDLRLPDMDDLSLLRSLRHLAPDAAMILMTAYGTPETIADAEALGATVLAKPFKLEDLKRVVLG
jgi:ATP-dependent Lon protease